MIETPVPFVGLAAAAAVLAACAGQPPPATAPVAGPTTLAQTLPLGGRATYTIVDSAYIEADGERVRFRTRVGYEAEVRMRFRTDGDDLVFHTLTFEVRSAQGAFDALKHLASDESERELLETAELDEEGRVRRVAFAWTVAGNRVHEEWDNTVLGNIEIDGPRLAVHVNSAERAARFRGILEERLGDDARHAGTEVQSLEDALQERAAGGGSPEPSEPAGLSEHPEVRQRLHELTSAHYDRWVTEEIPVLGGLSPLEAVGTPAGREKVQALIDQIERDGRRMKPPLDEAVVVRLRQRLGLSGGEGPGVEHLHG